MLNWAKELLSPTVQTGKPVEATQSDSRRKSKDEETTEEGFVCVGKSSFFQSPEMPAPIYSQQRMSIDPVTGPTTMYPILPYPLPNAQISASPDNSDLVKRIPFNLRSGLSTQGGYGGGRLQQKPFEVYLSQFRSQGRERYDYDFSFERGVIQE